MAPASVRILIIEDEAKTRASLEEGLRLQGWEVAIAATGDEASDLLARENYDLVVLDWLLPGRDGIDLLKQLRRRGSQSPVLMLTARDRVGDRVAGLEEGADDYLTKPFAFAELLARIRALLRRSAVAASPSPSVACADLELDVRARVARRSGQEIALTPREVDVLEYLVAHQGQVVTREMLERDVWKQANRITPLDNVIDVQMARLRRKVDGDPARPRLIHTLRGLGYKLGIEPGS